MRSCGVVLVHQTEAREPRRDPAKSTQFLYVPWVQHPSEFGRGKLSRSLQMTIIDSRD
jgi:hypothetical protein